MTGNEYLAGVIKVKIGLIMEEVEKLSKSNEPLKVVEEDPRLKILYMLSGAYADLFNLIVTDSDNKKTLEELEKKLSEK
jgi:hypothetical protein